MARRRRSSSAGKRLLQRLNKRCGKKTKHNGNLLSFDLNDVIPHYVGSKLNKRDSLVFAAEGWLAASYLNTGDIVVAHGQLQKQVHLKNSNRLRILKSEGHNIISMHDVDNKKDDGNSKDDIYEIQIYCISSDKKYTYQENFKGNDYFQGLFTETDGVCLIGSKTMTHLDYEGNVILRFQPDKPLFKSKILSHLSSMIGGQVLVTYTDAMNVIESYCTSTLKVKFRAETENMDEGWVTIKQNNDIIVGTTVERIFCWNKNTHELIFSKETPSSLSSIHILKNLVIAGDLEGNIKVFGLNTTDAYTIYTDANNSTSSPSTRRKNLIEQLNTRVSSIDLIENFVFIGKRNGLAVFNLFVKESERLDMVQTKSRVLRTHVGEGYIYFITEETKENSSQLYVWRPNRNQWKTSQLVGSDTLYTMTTIKPFINGVVCALTPDSSQDVYHSLSLVVASHHGSDMISLLLEYALDKELNVDIKKRAKKLNFIMEEYYSQESSEEFYYFLPENSTASMVYTSVFNLYLEGLAMRIQKVLERLVKKGTDDVLEWLDEIVREFTNILDSIPCIVIRAIKDIVSKGMNKYKSKGATEDIFIKASTALLVHRGLCTFLREPLDCLKCANIKASKASPLTFNVKASRNVSTVCSAMRVLSGEIDSAEFIDEQVECYIERHKGHVKQKIEELFKRTPLDDKPIKVKKKQLNQALQTIGNFVLHSKDKITANFPDDDVLLQSALKLFIAVNLKALHGYDDLLDEKSLKTSSSSPTKSMGEKWFYDDGIVGVEGGELTRSLTKQPSTFELQRTTTSNISEKKRLDKEMTSRSFTIVLFFKGCWCAFDRYYLRSWRSYVREIMFKNGGLVGISSQTTAKMIKTREKWRLNFPLIGDTNGEISSGYSLQKDTRGLNPEGTKNVILPGVYVIGSDGTPWYTWSSMPCNQNLIGTTDRPKPKHVMAIINSILGLTHQSCSKDSPSLYLTNKGS